jgi:hypothetical protein
MDRSCLSCSQRTFFKLGPSQEYKRTLGTKGPLYWLQESQTSRYLSRIMNFSVFLNVNIAGILAPDPDRFSGPKRGFSRILEKQ